MNWARENKSLTAFLVVVAIGAAVLGFLLFTTYGKFSKTSATYETDAKELKRLQALKPYPDSESLKAEETQRDAYAAEIKDLQTRLAAMEFPLVPLTPEQFQDELRRSVSEALEKAKGNGTVLPEDFYLGFRQYRDGLPNGTAAGPLGRQLEAIRFVVSVILDNRVTSMTEVAREPLPEESGAAPPRNARDSRNKREEAPSEPLVSRYPFTVGFVSNQPVFRRILNTIASAPQQFFVVELLAVQNEELTAPSRSQEVAAPAEVPGEDPVLAESGEPVPAASPAPGRIPLVVGDEKVTVRLKINILDFKDPAQREEAAEEKEQ